MNSSSDPAQIARFAYPLGLLLLLAPLLELAGRIWPIQWYLVQWRFQAELATVNAAPVLLLGALVVAVVAYLSESVGVLKLAGILLVTFGVLLLPIVALMALDAMQVRQMARAELSGPIRNNAILAVLRGLVAALAATSLGIGAMKAAKAMTLSVAPRRSGGARGERDADSPLIMMGDAGN